MKGYTVASETVVWVSLVGEPCWSTDITGFTPQL